MGTFSEGIRIISLVLLVSVSTKCYANDILGCGGFVKSHVNLDFSKIEIGLYTKEGSLKEKTECAPTNGYYFLPLYDKGEYVLKVHPPAGWSFEPSEVNLNVDGVSDQCSTGQDVNFSFNGFGITGRVITAGQKEGPSGISVQLVNEKGDVRETVTGSGGDFHFTPVIPGKYTVKASHPRWKLEPSQAVVQVKEGNTAMPAGVLAVKGYDVKGSVMSSGNPITGLYVLLYSKEASPKYRVEGCNTALLQGVPDAPICHSVTDGSGQFSFGLVPAGEYRLLALSKAPGQTAVSFNVKPSEVSFSVLHDSLYIKNAFEVASVTVSSSVVSTSGEGMGGARVTAVGAAGAVRAAAASDAAGRYTLRDLPPGTYTVSVEHEQAQFEDVQLSISPGGAVAAPPSRAARWRVCGALTPPAPRHVLLAGLRVRSDDNGKWCTFVPPGTYTARVEVSESEQRDGLQYYPVSAAVRVAHTSVSDISFSVLRARVHGAVQCHAAAAGTPACRELRVTLRALAPDGSAAGEPRVTHVKDGQYAFEDVLPGGVEVSVGGEGGQGGRLCWAEAAHNVAVASRSALVPPFTQTGHVLLVTASHDLEIDYVSEDGKEKGTLSVVAGSNSVCIGSGAPNRYTLTPRGCHRVEPASAAADTGAAHTPSVNFVATSHAVVLRVTSPDPVKDLVLKINMDGHGTQTTAPIAAQPRPGGGYTYEHTLYMHEGSLAVVSAWSSSLLFSPAAPQQVAGAADCQPAALQLRAARGLTLSGAVRPPVAGVAVSLHADTDEVLQTLVTDASGTYKFGPLDASRQYRVAAEKESYVFSEPDARGDIAAHKLAAVGVTLVDDADGKPLQGALVSLSGGAYRRTLPAGGRGELRFPALAPGQYYAKPLLKEYRFTPPHRLLAVAEGEDLAVTLRGVRVAWSCVGSLVSLAGAAWPRAQLRAVPAPHAHPAGQPDGHCPSEEAVTEDNGAFRIRGLLPGCAYSLQLKEAAAPELAGLRLATAPPTIQVKENKDIENIKLIAIQPTQITDTNILVYTPNIDHYKTLRLTLSLENTPDSPIYSTKLDPIGYNQYINPGLMYAMPRLPADNKTYIVQLESTLSKVTHSYEDVVSYFTSDGQFKYFKLEFLPKTQSSEQELRATSLLVLPLAALLALAYRRRARLLALAASTAGACTATATSSTSTTSAAGQGARKKKQ